METNNTLNGTSKSKIVIITSDAIEFELQKNKFCASREHPMLSGLFEAMNCDLNQQLEEKIQLPLIETDALHSDIIKIIINFCEKQYENSPNKINGTVDEIYSIIREHTLFHINQGFNFDEGILIFDKCDFVKYPIPQTFWYTLKNDIRPKFDDICKSLYKEIKGNIDKMEIKDEYLTMEKQRDMLNDFWHHVMHYHDNGFCCHEDERLPENSGFGKSTHVVPEWSREILEQYKKDLEINPLDSSFLLRIAIAADYLNIPQLFEDASHLISEFCEDKNPDELRILFKQPNDIPLCEKAELEDLISHIDLTQ